MNSAATGIQPGDIPPPGERIQAQLSLDAQFVLRALRDDKFEADLDLLREASDALRQAVDLAHARASRQTEGKPHAKAT